MSSSESAVPLQARAATKPRDRILATARALFRKHGIRGVGVDAIAEAAGTNKMTLYRHFGSKDELVVACLEAASAETQALWSDLERAHPSDPRAQLQAWIARAADYLDTDGRGCDVSNAAVELAEGDHPAREAIRAFKRAHRDRLADLCRGAGLDDPDIAADTLILLLEGARVTGQSVGSEGSGRRFRDAGSAMLRRFGGTPPRAAQA